MNDARHWIALALLLGFSAVGLTACGGGVECGPGTKAQDGQCVLADKACKEGTKLEDGECVPESETVCSDGTEWDSEQGTCVAVATCGPKTEVQDGECRPTPEACGEKASLDMKQGKCVPDQTCQEDDVVVDGVCVRPAQKLANMAKAEAENNDPEQGGSPTKVETKAVGETTAFKGTIAEPMDRDGDGSPDQDVDVFQFDAKAGNWFKIAVLSIGLPAPWFAVRGPGGWVREGPTGVEADPARRIAIPRDGTYTVWIQPSSVALDSNVGPVGSSEWSYAGSLEQIDGPNASDVDLTSKSLKGSYRDLTDNLYTATGLSGGDVVEFEVKRDGAQADGLLSIWSDLSTYAGELDLAKGTTAKVAVPSGVSGKVPLLVDWRSLTGPNAGYEIDATVRQDAENIGSVGVDSRASSGNSTLMDDSTKLYTFSVPPGQVIELSHDNNEGEEVDFVLYDSGGNRVLEETFVDAQSDFSADYHYYFSKFGGSYVLEATATSDLTDLRVDIRTISPNSLKSGKPGDTLSGQYGSSIGEGQSGFYTFKLNEASKAELTVTVNNSRDFDVILRDENFNELFRDGARSETEVTVSAERLGPGRYFIQVGNDDMLNANSVEITLTQPPIFESEPNDSPGNATPAEFGREHAGDSDRNDPDYFQFQLGQDLPNDEVIFAEIDNFLETDEYNCQLLDASDNVLDEVKDRDFGCALAAGGLTSGKYYFKVAIDSPASEPYSARIERRKGTVEGEPNDSRSQATSVNFDTLNNKDGFVYGRLTPSDTTDFLEIQLANAVPGGKVLAVLSAFTGPDPVRRSMGWELQDSSGSVLASSGFKFAGSKESLSAGTYYLKIDVQRSDLEAASGEDGEYRIGASVFDVSSSKTPGASIPDDDTSGTDVTFSVSSCATVDHVNVNVQIDHTSEDDLAIELEAPSGDTVVLKREDSSTGSYWGGNYPLFYTPEDSLSSLFGKSGNGTWRLNVADVEAGTTGTLQETMLNVRCK